MKTSKKIEIWARIGQVTFWLFCKFFADLQEQLPMYEATEHSGTATEFVLAVFCLILAILFSEAIVRLISYFAKLLDK